MVRIRSQRVWLMAVAGLLAAPVLAWAQPAPGYLITDLGSLSGATGTSRGFGISPNGQFITGLTTVSGGATLPFRFTLSSGTTSSINALVGTTNGVGFGVNNTGTVTGYSTTASIASGVFDFNAADRAFTAAGSAPVAVPILSNSGFSGQAYIANRGQGINASGEISGYAFNIAGGDAQGFRFTSGTPTPLNYLPAGSGLGTGTLGQTFGINATGQIAGFSDRDNSLPTPNPIFPVRYASGSATPTELPLVAGFNSAYPAAINDPGRVAGYADNSGSGPTRGYFYNGATATSLGVLTGGDSSFANAIDNGDRVVGQSNTSAGGSAFRAVFFNGSTAVDLNGLLTGPGSAGWTLQSAEGTSDLGQIVGFGVNPGGLVRAFLLTPVPEPGTLLLAGSSAVGLAFGAWRRRRSRARLPAKLAV